MDFKKGFEYFVNNLTNPQDNNKLNEINFFFQKCINENNVQCLNFLLGVLNSTENFIELKLASSWLRKFKNFSGRIKEHVFKLIFGGFKTPPPKLFEENEDLYLNLLKVNPTQKEGLFICKQWFSIPFETHSRKMNLLFVKLIKHHFESGSFNNVFNGDFFIELWKRLSLLLINTEIGIDQEIDLILGTINPFFHKIPKKANVTFEFLNEHLLKRLDRNCTLKLIHNFIVMPGFIKSSLQITKILNHLSVYCTVKSFEETTFLQFILSTLLLFKLDRNQCNIIKKILFRYYCGKEVVENEINFAMNNPYEYYMTNLFGNNELIEKIVFTLYKKFKLAFFDLYDPKSITPQNSTVLKLITPLLGKDVSLAIQFDKLYHKRTLPFLNSLTYQSNVSVLVILEQIKFSFMYQRVYPKTINLNMFLSCIGGLLKTVCVLEAPDVIALYSIRHLTYLFEKMPMNMLNDQNLGLRKIFNDFVIWAFQKIEKKVIKFDYSKELITLIYTFLKNYRPFVDVSLIIKLTSVLRRLITFKNTNPETFRILFECIALEVKSTKVEILKNNTFFIENNLVLLSKYLFGLINDHNENFVKSIFHYVLQILILLTKFHFIKISTRPNFFENGPAKDDNGVGLILLNILTYYNSMCKFNGNVFSVKVFNIEENKTVSFFKTIFTGVKLKREIIEEFYDKLFLLLTNIKRATNSFDPLIILTIYSLRKGFIDFQKNQHFNEFLKIQVAHFQKLKLFYKMYFEKSFEKLNKFPLENEINFGFQLGNFVLLQEFELGIKELSLIDYI